MKLYFGNTVTAVTTIMTAILIAFVALTIYKRAGIPFGDEDAHSCSYTAL